MIYVLMVVGFALLLKGGDLIVEGGGGVARRFGVSEMAVGLTIVSMGTSLPELIVTLFASGRGSSEAAIGNVLGSSIANILLILGIASLIRELKIRDSTLLSEIPFALTATLLVGFLANAALFSQSAILTISRLDGAILIGFFSLFLGYVYRVSKYEVGKRASGEKRPLLADGVRVVLGAAGLAIGGYWVVDGALGLSEQLHLSESFVGLTVLAVGTSLPELAAVSMAAYRGKADMAVGTVVGSNIFNFLWVLGLSATVRPLPFDVVSNSDILMVILSSTALIMAVAIGRPNTIERWEGGGFLLLYVAYLRFLVLRG